MRGVVRFLKRAVEDGHDLEAREGMAYASLMGAFSLSDGGTCAMHAMSETLGAYGHDLPHGAALICLCEPYFSFYAKHRVEKLIELGRIMGEDVDALEGDEKYMAPVYALRKLKKACGVENITLLDWGLDPSKFAEIAHKSRDSHMRLFNKDPFMLDEEQVVEIIKEACGL